MQTAAKGIAEAIRIERKMRGMSQAALAREIETGEKSIRLWESGESAPSWEMYERLCRVFAWPLPYSGDSTKASKLTPLLMEELALAQMA